MSTIAEKKIQAQRARAALLKIPYPGGPAVVGNGFVVPDEPLDRRRMAAARKLGTQNTRQTLDQPPPPNWRPLQGARDLNRGNSIISYAFDSAGALRVGTTSEPVFETAKNVGQDSEAMSVVLGVYVSPSEDVDIVQPVEVYADVQFGIGGASYRMQCDWSLGSVLVLPASFVRVNAVRTIYEGGTPEDNPDLVLSASLGYGSPNAHGRSSGAKRTISRTLAAGDTSGTIRIPPFATSFVVSSASSSPNVVVTMRPDAGSSFPDCARYVFDDATSSGDNAEGARSIPGNAQYLAVQNQGLASDAISVIFTLAV